MAEPLISGQINLVAVGDIMLGDSHLRLGHGVGSSIKKIGAKTTFQQVAPVLKKGDIVFGNLEAVFSNQDSYSKTCSLPMRASYESVEGLLFAGFNVLSLANNHILEYGERALTETKDILSKHNIKYIGIGKTPIESRQPLILEFKGIQVAFLAYCLIPDKTAFISTNNTEEICSDVSFAKSIADLVIVSMHWGSEFIEKPSLSQVNLAHRIVDAGANVILGHHPHVLQGIENYQHGLIAYSLGNFIFDMNYIKETGDSVILNCRLSKNGVIGYSLHPLRSDSKYNPFILNKEDKLKVLSRLQQLSFQLEKTSECDTQKYEKRVLELRRLASKRMIRHFLLNIYRYPLPFTLKIIVNYFTKG